MRPSRSCLLLAVLICGGAAAQTAPGSGSSTDDIARKLADPGAALISVPFQYNYLGSVGPGGDFHNQQLKIQPVIPFVGEHGKFILRPILPIQWNQYPQDRSGTGDLFVQGYYIPKTEAEAQGTEFGFGAAALLDTASHDSLGTGRYSLGPAFILVHKTRNWTLGALANHVWSIGGDGDRDDVSTTSLQPFVTRNLPGGWSVGMTSETSYNWKAGSGNGWTVPLGATVSKVLHLGKTPFSLGAGAFYNVDRPQYANRWSARFTLTLVFPE
ncbi:hypothetical protein [Stenotrophomonas sp. AB1(2024)]|uniref:hypothetical protein n=1 Tax=Stenotrophomonas sp. AB1(2024) TaxID=3132215 RepID=UPI0030AEA70D